MTGLALTLFLSLLAWFEWDRLTGRDYDRQFQRLMNNRWDD